jgi:glycosyltransferase involved in cell wall biosynthesis
VRIAQIAPLYESVPPKLYGGTERVVAHLTDALVDLGHEVTLFAAADARVKGRLVAVRDQSIRLDAAPLKSDLAAHLTMLYEVKRRAQQFDVLHFHVDMLHFTMFEQQAHKVITTLHGRLDLKDLPQAYQRWPQFPLVSISDHQRRPLPAARWIATVPHGFPADLYTYCARPSNKYFAFLGRISPEKRPDIAIRLALRTGIPLKIAAKVDAVDVAYFEAVVKPLLKNPLIEFIGEIGDDRKSEFLGNARCLLFPIDWPEPFGLVMIEAMACGTPVIAWNCGSVPEVVEEGVTGFIVESEEQAIAAVARLPSINRRNVRAAFEQRFTASIMARTYLNVYSGMLQAHANAMRNIKTAAETV